MCSKGARSGRSIGEFHSPDARIGREYAAGLCCDRLPLSSLQPIVDTRGSSAPGLSSVAFPELAISLLPVSWEYRLPFPSTSRLESDQEQDHPRSGYIGLQDHGADIWFKNIKLLPLKD